MHRVTGVLATCCMLALCGACGTYTAGGTDRTQSLRYDDSVSGLMRYCSHVATLSGEPYEKELGEVTRSYNQSLNRMRGASDFQTLRMAIALMNASADDPKTQYRRAEALLADHLDESSPDYFDKEYRPLARFLLTVNREWQSIHNELTVARVEKARIEKQIEQLKSIEMEMNSPGNNFH